MSKKIKLKDLLNENFSGAMMGGLVSRSAFDTDTSLSKMVKEKYGDVDDQTVDVEGLTTEIAQFNEIGEAIFGKSNITKISEKLSRIASQAKSHTLQETDSWFDKITVNRNMKELTGLSKQFSKKYGVSSPDELDDEKKKDFFNYVDKNWQGDNEAD